MGTQLVMYEEEFTKINAVCDRLTKDANAKVVFLVDKNGQLISSAGQTQNIDTTSLASLTAGNVAAMGGRLLSIRGVRSAVLTSEIHSRNLPPEVLGGSKAQVERTRRSVHAHGHATGDV